MADLLLLLYQFESLLHQHLPLLSEHFDHVGVQANMYAAQWFMTLYAATFSAALASRIMDIFLMHGFTFVLQVRLRAYIGFLSGIQ